MADKPKPAEPAISEDVPRGTSESPVVLHWRGDEGVFTNGVPNRDVTEADGLSDEAVELALTNGTHTRI